MILLKDALELMENLDEKGHAVPFKITFCTADRERNTGGEIITLEKAVLMKNQHPKSRRAQAQQIASTSKPNQFQNATRNLINLVNGDPIKIHIHLIDAINGSTVIW